MTQTDVDLPDRPGRVARTVFAIADRIWVRPLRPDCPDCGMDAGWGDYHKRKT